MRVWLDGALVDESQARVSVYDHGFTTGDGVFESVKVVGGEPFALTRHLDRLARSAKELDLPAPDPGRIRDGVSELLADNPALTQARLRITLTGGVGPLGSQRGEAGPTLVMALAPLEHAEGSCDVAFVPWPRNEYGALAGVKSTSYAENVRALAYARRQGAGEAIFANIAGNLCEGTGANVFIVHEGRLMTPPLRAGCLAGVTRDLLVEWVGAAEVEVPAERLRDAEEAFLTSTARDVQPIRMVDGWPLGAVPGPHTAKAIEVFAQRSAEGVDP